MTQAFIDTLVVVSFARLAIIVTGVWTTGKTGAGLTRMAFENGLAGQLGGIIVTLGVACSHSRPCWDGRITVSAIWTGCSAVAPCRRTALLFRRRVPGSRAGVGSRLDLRQYHERTDGSAEPRRPFAPVGPHRPGDQTILLLARLTRAGGEVPYQNLDTHGNEIARSPRSRILQRRLPNRGRYLSKTTSPRILCTNMCEGYIRHASLARTGEMSRRPLG